jgi:hypothetical protein
MTLGRMSFKKGTVTDISDEQFVQELRAEHRLREAAEELRRAIADVNMTSALVEIKPSAFVEFLNDECPGADFWAEKLLRARHGLS